MKRWCDLCDEVCHNVDEHSAKRIVDTIHKEEGRFIGREYKPAKFYVMSKEEAIKLTEKALSHVYVDDFNENTDRYIYFGRGGQSNNNKANVAWRKAIQGQLDKYINVELRVRKKEIATEIVCQAKQEGGEFVTDKDSVKGKYYIVSDKEAIERTKPRFRDTQPNKARKKRRKKRAFGRRRILSKTIREARD
jgi:hypothetical protein